MSENEASVEQAVHALKQGQVIAYPTEAVFGLGCDPDNEAAIQHLLDLKHRPSEKGLIIIASAISQLDRYINAEAVSDEMWQQLNNTWPGPVTWLIPAGPSLSKLLTGEHNTIAVRVTAHPIASKLCQEFGKPIVSTSANFAGQDPARNVYQVREQFLDQVGVIVGGEVDRTASPSEIRDLLTNKVIRKSE